MAFCCFFYSRCSSFNNARNGTVGIMKWFKSTPDDDDNDSPRLLSLSPLRHCDQNTTATTAAAPKADDNITEVGSHPRNKTTTALRSSPGTRSFADHRDGEFING